MLFSIIVSYTQSLRNQAEESGQGLVEYALILVLVALVVVAMLTLFGGSLSNVYATITNALGDM
jgi:pilus assembly protein Flp/PilA